MENLLRCIAWILLATGWGALACPAYAGEGYFYEGSGAKTASFPLIGGHYTLYVYAKRPVLGYSAPETRECIFGGNLQRVWPTQDVMPLGSGVTLSTIVPHKIGPTTLTLPEGVYRLYIAPLTSCAWHFVLESTNQNTAGVAPVRTVIRRGGTLEISPTASIADMVQFSAQYRTDHGTKSQASGQVQIIHNGKIVRELPLQDGHDVTSGASTLFVDTHWEAGDRQYLGTNTVKFLVKIGATEFSSSGEFTLTQ